MPESDQATRLAVLKNDAASVNRMLADDFYSINTGGQRAEAGNKGKGPFNTMPNGDKWERAELRDVRVKAYGDSAVATALRHVDVKNKDGSARVVDLVATHVWTRRDGRWLIVLSQSTAVLPPPTK